MLQAISRRNGKNVIDLLLVYLKFFGEEFLVDRKEEFGDWAPLRGSVECGVILIYSRIKIWNWVSFSASYELLQFKLNPLNRQISQDLSIWREFVGFEAFSLITGDFLWAEIDHRFKINLIESRIYT